MTGGSRGIGFAIAEHLARTGLDVALVARNASGAADAAERIAAATSRQAIGIPLDLRDPQAPAAALELVTARLGSPSVVVNNAGTAPSARFESTTDDALEEVLDLHVRAPFRLLRAALPAMRDGGGGVMVQLASSAGLRGYPFTAAYTAAKHGMVGLTRALAVELAREPTLRVYAVCPGFVDTEITRSAAATVAARGRSSTEQAFAAMAAMNRTGRMHTVDEVAGAVARLVEERPAGVVLDLDRDPPQFVP